MCIGVVPALAAPMAPLAVAVVAATALGCSGDTPRSSAAVVLVLVLVLVLAAAAAAAARFSTASGVAASRKARSASWS